MMMKKEKVIILGKKELFQLLKKRFEYIKVFNYFINYHNYKYFKKLSNNSFKS